VQFAGGAERAEQPGMLLVAGEDLIAAAEAQALDDLRMPSVVQVVSATSGVAAEHAGVGDAQRVVELGAPREVRWVRPSASSRSIS